MGIPIGERHVAIATDLVEVERLCAACGHRARASVLVQSAGSAEAPFFLFASDARDRAARAAVAGVPRAARQRADLAPCPRCHRRDRQAALLCLVDAAIGPVISSPLSWLIGTVITMIVLAAVSERPRDLGVNPMLGGGLLAVVVCALWTRRNWRRRTRWNDEIAVEMRDG